MINQCCQKAVHQISVIVLSMVSVLAAMEAGDLPGVARRMYNVFEDVLSERHKREIAKKKDTDLRKDAASAAPEFTTVSIKATVIDQTCCVKTVGIKTPKTIKEFTVVFQTENEETLKWNVPEEMYDGFEKGQSGTLSVVDGELYGFELSGTDSSDP